MKSEGLMVKYQFQGLLQWIAIETPLYGNKSKQGFKILTTLKEIANNKGGEVIGMLILHNGD